jgi:hypothetical protein
MHKRILVAVATFTTGLVVMIGIAVAGWRVTGTTVAPVEAADARLDVSGGAVSDVHPGGVRPALLTVGNPNTFPVELTGFAFLDVVVDPAHPGCPASVISIQSAPPPTTLLPLQDQQFEVGVGMDPAAPQACLGATFEVTWEAVGRVGTP